VIYKVYECLVIELLIFHVI